MSFYNTIEAESTAEFKDRGSRFLAYAYPFPDAAELKHYLQTLKKEHPKAAHFCFAYRVGNNKDNYRSSDNGEPAGTAGKPIMGRIDSKELTDVLIIVVRYFGGTLLGVPGLINAYKSAASMVLQVTPTVRKDVFINWLIQFNYTETNDVLAVIKQNNCIVIHREDCLFSELKVGIPEDKQDNVIRDLRDIQNVHLKRITKA